MPWVTRLRDKLALTGVKEFVRSIRSDADLPPTGLPKDPRTDDHYEIAWLRIYSNRYGVEWYRGDKPFDPFAARTRFTEAQAKKVREGVWKLVAYLGLPLVSPAVFDLEQLILFGTLGEDFAEGYAVPTTKGEKELGLRLTLDHLKVIA